MKKNVKTKTLLFLFFSFFIAHKSMLHDNDRAKKGTKENLNFLDQNLRLSHVRGYFLIRLSQSGEDKRY